MVLAVIGVALLAAIVTFLILLAVRPPKKQVSTPYRTIPPPSSTTVAPSTTVPTEQAPVLTPAALKRLTSDLVPFVEKRRQLTFTEQPAPVLESDAAYLKSWHALLAQNVPVLTRLETPFKVLGLNPNGIDLVDAQAAFYGDNGVAFYDAKANVIHVRAVQGTTYVSAMLVKSLTEQLDDQHFTVASLGDSKGFGDDTIGPTTLIVGDGVRIASQWLGTQDQLKADQAFQEQSRRTGTFNDPSQVPQALARWLILPLDTGVTYTSDAVTSTSSTQLDALFENPPDGSAQIVTSNRYQAGIHQLAVATPKADGKVDASGTFGAFYLQEVLGAVVTGDPLQAAMNRYAGDAMVTWKDGKRSCIRLDVSTGTNQIEPMRSALAEFAKQTDGTVSLQKDTKRPGRQVVRLDLCDPSTSGGSGATTTTTAPAGPGGGSVAPDTGSPA